MHDAEELDTQLKREHFTSQIPLSAQHLQNHCLPFLRCHADGPTKARSFSTLPFPLPPYGIPAGFSHCVSPVFSL